MEYVTVSCDALQDEFLYLEPSRDTAQALSEIQSGDLIAQSLAERTACIFGQFSRNARRLIKHDRAKLVASGLEDLDPKYFLVTKIFLRNEKRILKHLTSREKFFMYDNMKKLSNPKLVIPESGTCLKSDFHDHSLDDLSYLNGLPVEFSQNLAGFRSFHCSRFLTDEKQENSDKPLIICLYKKAFGKLLLANIGKHSYHLFRRNRKGDSDG